jgi:2-methylcitrate dehydratase PrpD
MSPAAGDLPADEGRQAQTLTAAIARHVWRHRVRRSARIDRCRDQARASDGIGVILAASGLSEDARPFVALAEAQGGKPSATILGYGHAFPPALAAFANGAMAHALDYEDAFDPAPVHPNASLIPAALAIAEARGPVSGEELIAAGRDRLRPGVQARLSLRRPMEDGGWYPPPILGAFGAAAAAARLMRLGPRQVADCLSHVMLQVSCPGEIKYSADTVLRAVREAFPAQAAVISAELASRGVRGFERPLEGTAGFFRLYANGEYEPADILDGLGRNYWIEHLSFKPWPACRGTHAYIELAQTLSRSRGFRPDEITEVRVFGGPIQEMLVYPERQKKRPATAIDAKFSLPFTIALALVRGEVTLDSFGAGALGDRDILATAARIVFEERADWGRDRGSAGALEIRLQDGSVHSGELDEALGHPTRPLSDADLRTKFTDCAGRARTNLFSAEAALAAAEQIDSLESVADVRELAIFERARALSATAGVQANRPGEAS